LGFEKLEERIICGFSRKGGEHDEDGSQSVLVEKVKEGKVMRFSKI
jgi:hypothetical protein